MTATTTKNTAMKAESAGDPITIDHYGFTFTIPQPRRMPVALLDCKDEIEVVKLILGPDQWDAYKESGATIEDFEELAQALAAAQGFGDSGN